MRGFERGARELRREEGLSIIGLTADLYHSHGNLKSYPFAHGGGSYSISRRCIDTPTVTFYFDDMIEQSIRLARFLSTIPPFPKKCLGVNLGIHALVSHTNKVDFDVKVESLEVCFMNGNPVTGAGIVGVRMGLEKEVGISLKLTKWAKQVREQSWNTNQHSACCCRR